MTALARLQRDFLGHIHGRDTGMTERVRTDATCAAAGRLQIYSDAYGLRLLEVLANDHPGLKALAGDEDFERLGRDYIGSHPSSHFNVRWYGGGLADFLRARSESPAYAEMAQLEWALTLVFDAADEPAVDAAAVAAIPPPAWPGMIAVPQQAAQRLKLHWNVAALRKAVDEGHELPAPAEAPGDWLVWRRDCEVYRRALDADEAAAFDASAGGACFAELCEALLHWHAEDQVALRAAALLRRWVEDGLIREIRLPPAA